MARAQGSQASAQLDTRLLLLAADNTTDLSQFLTDLTAMAGGAFEASSARAALTSTRTLWARIEFTDGEAGHVVTIHGNTAQTDYTWAISTQGSGSICLHQNGVTLWTASFVVKAQDYGISWAMRPNPDTTGASDAQISEVLIYSYTAATILEVEQFVHVAPTTDLTWYTNVGGWWDGIAPMFSTDNTVDELRISSNYHTLAEVHEEWIAPRPAYVGTANDAPSEPPGPVPATAGLAGVGYFAGRHPWGYQAAHANAERKRNWAPLVNEVYSSTPGANNEPTNAWLAGVPDSPSYSMPMQFVRWCVAPTGATHARVRVHVKSEPNVGGPYIVKLRCYAFNRLATTTTINGNGAPTLEYYYREVEITRDDTAIDGLWSDLGLVRLPRFTGAVPGWAGTVHLALAFDVDPGDNVNEFFRINAWHAQPSTVAMIGVFDP